MLVIYSNDDSAIHSVAWTVKDAVNRCEELEAIKLENIKVAEAAFAELEECTNHNLRVIIENEIKEYL